MKIPALVQSTLGDEEVAAHVPLKGEDALFVTGTRTLVYTADGLLSDENVTEHPHGAERVVINEGRRKAKITLDYGLDGDETVAVPSSKLDDVLHPIMAGVLNAADVTQPGETVKRTYRFSELTLVVTSDRVVKHVGSAVWDTEYEEIPFDIVTGIDVEDGSVSSQLVLETTRRTQRIKAPNEQFRDVRETVETAVFAYHDVSSAAEFERLNVEEGEQAAAGGAGEVSFGGGVEPIDTSGLDEDDTDEHEADAADANAASEASSPEAHASSPAAEASANGQATAASAQTEEQSAAGKPAETAEGDEFESSGFETAASKVEPPVDPDELDAELDELAAAIDEMAATLDRQREVIDAQQEILDAHREHLAALRDLTNDE